MMNRTDSVYNAVDEEELIEIAEKLALKLPQSCLITLIGPIGAGKTTFARALIHALGYQGRVKSPTFALLETYEIGTRTIHHLDLYRLSHALELENAGLRDIFSEQAVCLVEWPENGGDALPCPDLAIEFTLAQALRQIRCKAYSACGEHLAN